MFCNFTTTTHAKWILAGEHAVLRGHGALVFPLQNHKLTLSYTHDNSALKNAELTADYSGSNGADMSLLFWSVLQQGQQLLGHSLNRLSGHFHIESNIPIGVGMGASASLCVAMARWFAAQNLITTETIAQFARDLENLFHGQSSGLDIAGVNADIGVYFQQGKHQTITQSWQPCWYLSSCGQVGITSHCINQVKQLWETSPHLGQELDTLMSQTVKKAHLALETNTPNSIHLLTESIKDGATCFQQWGLVSETLSQHMQLLYQHGALAVKPTGSGNGGFVVSLWERPPEMPLPVEMIAL